MTSSGLFLPVILLVSIVYSLKLPGPCPVVPPSAPLDSLPLTPYIPDFTSIVGIPFANPGKSHFFRLLNESNAYAYTLKIQNASLLYLYSDPISADQIVAENHCRMDNATGELLMTSSVRWVWVDDDRVTDCGVIQHPVRLWRYDRLVIFWSCFPEDDGHDEALYITEMHSFITVSKSFAELKGHQKYVARLDYSREIASKYISPQLMAAIDWNPTKLTPEERKYVKHINDPYMSCSVWPNQTTEEHSTTALR